MTHLCLNGAFSTETECWKVLSHGQSIEHAEISADAQATHTYAPCLHITYSNVLYEFRLWAPVLHHLGQDQALTSGPPTTRLQQLREQPLLREFNTLSSKLHHQ